MTDRSHKSIVLWGASEEMCACEKESVGASGGTSNPTRGIVMDKGRLIDGIAEFSVDGNITQVHRLVNILATT